MIPPYPDAAPLALDQRPLLHPLFQKVESGISEFTFAGLYLFRHAYGYRVSDLGEGRRVFLGEGKIGPFFLLPFGLPDPAVLRDLFSVHGYMKCVSEDQVDALRGLGYSVEEDRDNFDYLYSREDLARLPGRKFHKKKNLVSAFVKNYTYEGKPLSSDLVPAAIDILERWHAAHEANADYGPAREALDRMEALEQCGGIYFVDGKPAAYSLGEENALGASFILHFEKAVPGYKGLYQFANQCFAAILPDKYKVINREQDLGDDGLRQAKESYRPIGFVKKYTAKFKV
jgi:hypothetical protein